MKRKFFAGFSRKNFKKPHNNFLAREFLIHLQKIMRTIFLNVKQFFKSRLKQRRIFFWWNTSTFLPVNILPSLFLFSFSTFTYINTAIQHASRTIISTLLCAHATNMSYWIRQVAVREWWKETFVWNYGA